MCVLFKPFVFYSDINSLWTQKNTENHNFSHVKPELYSHFKYFTAKVYYLNHLITFLQWWKPFVDIKLSLPRINTKKNVFFVVVVFSLKIIKIIKNIFFSHQKSLTVSIYYLKSPKRSTLCLKVSMIINWLCPK